jgi:hypothetical protein
MMGQRVWAGTALLFVFALGVFAGAFYERHHAARPTAGLSGAEVHEAAMAELEEVLGLDAAQIEQIHAVLAARQEFVQEAWEQVRPQVQSAMQEIHVEIAELLRPEQRQAYHEWLNRQRDESADERVLIIPH